MFHVQNIIRRKKKETHNIIWDFEMQIYLFILNRDSALVLIKRIKI